MARCIQELERIKGVQNGGDRGNQYKLADKDNLNLPTQKNLASDLKISQQQLQDYKKLTNLIPELQDLIESNQMKATVGYKIWAKMPQEEQVYSREICKNNRTSYKSLVQLGHISPWLIFRKVIHKIVDTKKGDVVG
ncbi:hypothetical protein KQH81_07910 [Clostridium cadaveris]|uniref:hypothetical protein n=1 Tax=Clostridium cadaveris TaxID=1529 RepID=UPI001E2BBEF3|nr:hypothetical protein [Clostridium cadaveris]UFH66435.1 hypothetical protein KQH81_07910 [Clostridium cadaveris]